MKKNVILERIQFWVKIKIQIFVYFYFGGKQTPSQSSDAATQE